MSDDRERNQAKLLGAHGRVEGHKFWPWEIAMAVSSKVHKSVRDLADAGFLTLVEDEGHFTFDPARRSDDPVDMDTVRTIAPKGQGGEGQLHNAQIVRDGDRKFILIGRGRLKAIAYRCWKTAEKLGKSRDELAEMDGGGGLQKIVANLFLGDEREAWRAIQAENAQRRDVSPIGQAMAIRHGLELELSIEQVAATMKLDPHTATNKLKLLELAKPVQDAVAAGEIGEAFAYQEFPKLERKAQVAALQDLREANSTKGEAARLAMAELKAGKKPQRREKDEPPPKKAPSKIKIKKWIDDLKDHEDRDKFTAGFRAGLMRAVGMNPRGVPDHVREALKAED